MKEIELPFSLPSSSEKNKTLRDLLNKDEITIIPGIYNTAVAQLAQNLGFKVVYIGGASTTLSMGIPDLGIIKMGEMAYEVEKVSKMISLPVICDVDVGYGDVAKTIEAFEKAGVSGIHIEDQEDFKKCGHLSNKKIVPIEEMVKKIKIAVETRKDNNFVIITRTDARDVTDIEDAIQRANAYVEAGADMIFPEALKTKEEFEHVAKKIKVPLLANMTEYGKTPYMTAEEFEKMGYRFVIFPVTTLRTSLKTAEDVLIELKNKGTQRNLVDDGKVKTRKELQELIRYSEWEDMINKKLAKEKA